MTKLPYLAELDFFHVDQRPARSRARLMRFYRECVRRQLYLNGSDKIHVSKNPTWCGRVETLIETFPDARFVILYRNPYETIPSLLKLMHMSWKRGGNMDAARITGATRVMTDLSYEHYLLPERTLARHPQTPVAIIDYRELVSAPRATLERVYADLGIPLSAQAREFLAAEDASAREHETTHRYSLEEFGLEHAEIHRKLAPLFSRFNWDATPPPPREKRS